MAEFCCAHFSLRGGGPSITGRRMLPTLRIGSRRMTHCGNSRRGMGLLKQGGYLTSDADGYLTLTELGRQTAEKIYERHIVIRDMLIHLGVDEETATQDACRIEHVISDKSFRAICRHAGK